MKKAIVQAVIEVPMSRRQALAATEQVPAHVESAGFKEVTAKLTGYSVMRGLTFVELELGVDDAMDDERLRQLAGATMIHFVLAAEGSARGGESEEFALRHTEVFWEGKEHEVYAVAVAGIGSTLGIGGGDEESMGQWDAFLSKFYNPVQHTPGEVAIKRVAIK